MLVVQARAFGYRPEYPVQEDIILAGIRGIGPDFQWHPLEQTIFRFLNERGLRIRLADGSRQTAGYEAGQSLQAVFLRHSMNKSLIAVWASPESRGRYRSNAGDHQQLAQCTALGIPNLETNLASHFSAVEPAPDPMSLESRDDLIAYLRYQDILALERLHRDLNLELTRLLDIESRQAFLLVTDPRGRLLALARLGSSRYDRPVLMSPHQPVVPRIRDLLMGRTDFLVRETQP